MAIYEEFGFQNTGELFKNAIKGGYAVPAFNFVFLEQLLAIADACVETESPVIMQTSANVRKMIGPEMVNAMSRACVKMIHEQKPCLPAVLHLDHGLTFEECKSCIDEGYSSVMIDGSSLPFQDNAELTKKVADYAHRFGVSVEGELGAVSGFEDGVSNTGRFTDPDDCYRFVRETGVDSLAVSVGTSHGLNKRAHAAPGGNVIMFDILAEIEMKLGEFPLVLHGASEIQKQYIDRINRCGGAVNDYGGVPAEELKRAAKTNVAKINVASDGWIAATAAVREVLAETPGLTDPRKFLLKARKEMAELYIYKITEIMDSGRK